MTTIEPDDGYQIDRGNQPWEFYERQQAVELQRALGLSDAGWRRLEEMTREWFFCPRGDRITPTMCRRRQADGCGGCERGR